MSLTLRALVLIVAGLVSIGGAATGWYIEAESVTAVSPWVVQSTKTGYTGTGYLFNAGTSQLSPGGHMQYTFTVTEAGTYKADLHGRRDDEGNCAGEADDQCNDIYTQWDNGTKYKTMMKGPCDVGGCVLWNAWFWQSQIEVSSSSFPTNTKSLSVGTHTFHIEARSKGTKLDAIAIYKEGTTRPQPGTTDAQDGHRVRRTNVALAASEPVDIFSSRGCFVGRATPAQLVGAQGSLPRGVYYFRAPGMSEPVGFVVGR